MTYSRKKIFLTGGNGFIGRNIYEKLHGKYDFLAPSHIQLDLLDFGSVERFFKKNGPFDIVLHAAIVGGNRMTGDGSPYAFDSLRMFFNVASNEKFFKRFFYFGSGIEYGKEAPIKNFGEDSFGIRVPKSNWGLFKYICAQKVEKSSDFLNLRTFGAFGKYEDSRIRFITNSIYKNINGMPIVIHQNIKMDYIYCDDLIKVVEFFIENKNKSSSYNVTTGKGIDLIKIAKIVNSVSQNKVEIRILKRGLSPEYTGSNKHLIKELGNFHFTEIEDSIKDLYQWCSKHPIDPQQLKKEYI